MKYIVIFHTFSGVMSLEKFLKKKGIEYMTMPAPRELSVDCGVAVTFKGDYQLVLKEGPVHNIHRIYTANDKKMIFEND